MAKVDNFDEIKEYAKELESSLSTRNKDYADIEKMFMLDWEKKPTGENLQITISPDVRNAALGAIRLMIATDPQFSIPYNKGKPEAKKQSELLETVAASMWYMSGRTTQIPPEADAVTSGVLFGETHIAVTDTDKLLKNSKGNSPAAQKRLERAAERTPMIFEAINPMEGYPDFDSYGLAAYYRKQKVKGGRILDVWGSNVGKIITKEQRYDDFTYCQFWDAEAHAAWLEGGDKPIYLDSHGLPTIPIAAQIIDGSRVFSKIEYRSQPLLYTVLKSGLWERQNLWMTVFYSLLFNIGNGPIWGFEALNPERELEIEQNQFGGYYKFLKGESMTPMVNRIFDPEMMAAGQFADGKVEDSTLNKVALGAPLGGNAAHATISLMQHAGRLPLVSQQKRGGWVLGQAMEIAFELMKESKGGRTIHNKEGGVVEMDPGEIPENVMVEGVLQISLPQDDRMNAMTAVQLTSGEKPVTSLAWAREKVLNIGQSDLMQKEIWGEKFSELEAQKTYAIELQKVQAQIQAAMQADAMAAGAVPPGGQPGQPGQAPQPQGQPMPQPQMQQPPIGMPEQMADQSGQMPGDIAAMGGEGGMMDPAALAGMAPEQIRALMSQQGIPPEQQDQLLQAIMQQGGGGGPQMPGMGGQ